MLVKIYDDELVEIPDELAAMTLVNPGLSQDVPDYTLEEVNAVVHGVLGTFFEAGLTLEQNIAEVSDIYASQQAPSAANLEKALALIRYYNENIAVEDIARVRGELVFPCGGNNYPANSAYAINQLIEPTTVTALPIDLPGEGR